MKDTCEYCGGLIAIRNPTGNCDHLYYPDNVNKNMKNQPRPEKTNINDVPKGFSIEKTQKEGLSEHQVKEYKDLRRILWNKFSAPRGDCYYPDYIKEC